MAVLYLRQQLCSGWHGCSVRTAARCEILSNIIGLCQTFSVAARLTSALLLRFLKGRPVISSTNVGIRSDAQALLQKTRSGRGHNVRRFICLRFRLLLAFNRSSVWVSSQLGPNLIFIQLLFLADVRSCNTDQDQCIYMRSNCPNDENEPLHRCYLTLASIALNILPGGFAGMFYLILTSNVIRNYFFSDTRNIITRTKARCVLQTEIYVHTAI